MSDNNPFDESGRTVIRPNPGGRRAPASVSTPPQPARARAQASGERAARAMAVTENGINPLVGAAGTLLSLAAHLRDTAACDDLDELRDRIVAGIRLFEQKIATIDLPREALGAAHYALCATLDDVIANTPWGGSGRWARDSMAARFHGNVVGGEHFFSLLDRFERESGRFRDVLELLYLCLSLGFEGRLRVDRHGNAEWVRIRENLYHVIRNVRGEPERELSPHWPGLSRPLRPLTTFLPAWVTAAGAVAFATVLFVFLIFSLNASSDDAFERFANLPPPGGTVMIKVAAPAAAPPSDSSLVQRLRAFLAPEIKAGLVDVLDHPQYATVRLKGGEMFASGDNDLNSAELPAVRRIAAALDPEPGAINILGYTDNARIRSLRFPSNYQLSLARAETVRDIVRRTLKTPHQIAVDGRADADSIASNDTPDGRAQNRRIELNITKSGPP